MQQAIEERSSVIRIQTMLIAGEDNFCQTEVHPARWIKRSRDASESVCVPWNGSRQLIGPSADGDTATQGRSPLDGKPYWPPSLYRIDQPRTRSSSLPFARTAVSMPSDSSHRDSSPGSATPSIWRVMDANANRAAEGLRVVEDFLRFVRNDHRLAPRCKQLRHDLQTLLAAFPAGAFIESRDVAGDTGCATTTHQEYRRENLLDVVQANLKRTQQALRSLEEFGKTISASWAKDWELLRYQSYQLEQDILASIQLNTSLGSAVLCVLIDACDSQQEFRTRVQQLIDVEVPLLQLRDKKHADGLLLEYAHLVRQLTRGTSTRLVINDRTDIAVAADADGAHVGQEDLPAFAARKVLGPNRCLGVSTHSLEQAVEAEQNGADYIGVGPTFPSTTKSFSAFPGPELLARVVGRVSIPAFAIGGIDINNLSQVLGTGIKYVAVSSAIWRASRPDAAAGQFLKILRDNLQVTATSISEDTAKQSSSQYPTSKSNP